MSYKLPEEIFQKLKDKYSDVDLKNLVNDIFEEIRDKSIQDGSCLIKNFGCFYTYKTFSSRKGSYVPRFKFRISRAFEKKFSSDSYIQNAIQTNLTRVFDKRKEQNPNYILNNRNNKKNQSSMVNSQRIIAENSADRIFLDEISNILEEKSIISP